MRKQTAMFWKSTAETQCMNFWGKSAYELFIYSCLCILNLNNIFLLYYTEKNKNKALKLTEKPSEATATDLISKSGWRTVSVL